VAARGARAAASDKHTSVLDLTIPAGVLAIADEAFE
jgi:hypothetical protein